MKKYILGGVIAAAVLLSAQAFAVPVIAVADNYVGSNDHGYGDVIGNAGEFGITQAQFNQEGNTLYVDITTGIAGLTAGDGIGPFAGYTINGKGIGYGDLFLAPAWIPFGEAPYLTDNNATGTVWTYGFALDDNWSATSGGSGKLYGLSGTNDQSAVLSRDLFKSGVIVRDGQEVLVDTVGGFAVDTGRTGTWSAADGVVSFEIDISGTALNLYGDGIAFHWGPTCANDTIEGFTHVDTTDQRIPEPATVVLLSLGLLGIGAARRRARR